MKIEKEEKKINENGSYITKTVKTTTKEDGIISESDIYSTGSSSHYGEHHIGDMKVVSCATNDPRVTRPFAYSISILFMVIGTLLILFSDFVGKILGTFCLVIGIIAIRKAKEDIDEIEKKLKDKSDKEI